MYVFLHFLPFFFQIALYCSSEVLIIVTLVSIYVKFGRQTFDYPPSAILAYIVSDTHTYVENMIFFSYTYVNIDVVWVGTSILCTDRIKKGRVRTMNLNNKLRKGEQGEGKKMKNNKAYTYKSATSSV